MGYIYILKNKVNGKIYIGQTTRPIQKRLQEHRTGKSSNCVSIYRAIKKYGWGNFEKDWYECPDEDLNFDEELLVREMETVAPDGYNLREGGGSCGKPSDETKQRMSEAQIGKPKSEETKQKLSEALLGEKNPNFGKPKSDETKQKMSETQRGEKHHKSRRVYQYDLDGTFINSFGSSGEAGRHLKKSRSAISMCACGERKTAYGFKWSHS